MRVQITLKPSESKRLIAKGLVALPSIQDALKKHTIILAGGTTNGFILEELLGENITEKSKYTVGIITEGKTGVTDEEGRIHPYVITRGKARERDFRWKSYLAEMGPGDVFIKGGNAIDHTGLAAVLSSDSMGVLSALHGSSDTTKIELMVPIGLEKLIPDVREAIEFLAGKPIDEALGDKVGLMPMLELLLLQITALEALYDVRSKCIALAA